MQGRMFPSGEWDSAEMGEGMGWVDGWMEGRDVNCALVGQDR